MRGTTISSAVSRLADYWRSVRELRAEPRCSAGASRCLRRSSAAMVSGDGDESSVMGSAYSRYAGEDGEWRSRAVIEASYCADTRSFVERRVAGSV